MDQIWRYGVFLGRTLASDQNFIALSDGTVTRARAMIRVPESERWDADRVLGVTGIPTSLSNIGLDSLEEAEDPHKGPEGHRQDGPDDHDGPGLRRVPILLKDFDLYGFRIGAWNAMLIAWAIASEHTIITIPKPVAPGSTG